MMEPTQNDKPKGNTVLLTIIAVATLLVAVIGATFAYFSISITGNDTQSTSVIVKTATLGIAYESGQNLVADNMMPGDSATKEFTVDSSGDVDMTYKIKWVDVSNNFTRSDLKYTLAGSVIEGTGTAGEVTTATVAPTADGDMVSSVTIQPNSKHKYILTMTFESSVENQDSDQGKTFTAKIEVDNA